MHSVLIAFCLSIPGGSSMAVIQKAPSFSLTAQNGKTVSLGGLKGKVLLVGFVFTTCNGTCPATTHRMAKVQDAIRDRGLSKEVHLVSITLDPERDTPGVLQRYMSLYDLDPSSWTFLTGSPKKVKKVFTSWGMWAKPSANGQLDHPSRVFLVDGRGQIREIYNLSFFKTEWVLEDIQSLIPKAEQ